MTPLETLKAAGATAYADEEVDALAFMLAEDTSGAQDMARFVPGRLLVTLLERRPAVGKLRRTRSAAAFIVEVTWSGGPDSWTPDVIELALGQALDRHLDEFLEEIEAEIAMPEAGAELHITASAAKAADDG